MGNPMSVSLKIPRVTSWAADWSKVAPSDLARFPTRRIIRSIQVKTNTKGYGMRLMILYIVAASASATLTGMAGADRVDLGPNGSGGGQYPGHNVLPEALESVPLPNFLDSFRFSCLSHLFSTGTVNRPAPDLAVRVGFSTVESEEGK